MFNASFSVSFSFSFWFLIHVWRLSPPIGRSLFGKLLLHTILVFFFVVLWFIFDLDFTFLLNLTLGRFSGARIYRHFVWIFVRSLCAFRWCGLGGIDGRDTAQKRIKWQQFCARSMVFKLIMFLFAFGIFFLFFFFSNSHAFTLTGCCCAAALSWCVAKLTIIAGGGNHNRYHSQWCRRAMNECELCLFVCVCCCCFCYCCWSTHKLTQGRTHAKKRHWSLSLSQNTFTSETRCLTVCVTFARNASGWRV